MRKRAGWMNTAVDPLLELLAESGLALPPGAITYNLQRELGNAPSRSSITRAINVLTDHEYIRKAPGTNTYYEITETGRAYLRGEIDASDSP